MRRWLRCLKVTDSNSNHLVVLFLVITAEWQQAFVLYFLPGLHLFLLVLGLLAAVTFLLLLAGAGSDALEFIFRRALGRLLEQDLSFGSRLLVWGREGWGLKRQSVIIDNYCSVCVLYVPTGSLETTSLLTCRLLTTRCLHLCQDAAPLSLPPQSGLHFVRPPLEVIRPPDRFHCRHQVWASPGAANGTRQEVEHESLILNPQQSWTRVRHQSVVS